jgi:predicted nucleotide-binding protein
MIFISYSHDDSDWARSLAEALRKEDLDVWLDQWQVPVGESLPEALESGLRSSDAIVTLISDRNARRPNLFFELGFALGEGKKVIPVISPDVDAGKIPYDLRSRRYLLRGDARGVAHEVALALKEPA